MNKLTNEESRGKRTAQPLALFSNRPADFFPGVDTLGRGLLTRQVLFRRPRKDRVLYLHASIALDASIEGPYASVHDTET